MAKQYIPPQSLIDYLKINNHDESLVNPVLKPETNKIQVKTASLIISAETTNNVDRDSPEFQKIVQLLGETMRLKETFNEYNFKNDENTHLIKSNGHVPTTPSLNTPKSSSKSSLKTSGKTKHGFAEGFTMPANTPKRRSHQLNENSEKLQHALLSQSFPEDNSDSDASCDSDYELFEEEVTERTVQHDKEERKKSDIMFVSR